MRRAKHLSFLMLASLLLAAPSSAATCGRYSATSSNSATTSGRYQLCPVALVGGFTYTFTTCGFTTGDSYIRLFDTANSAQITFNDNYTPCSSNTRSSRIVYTVPCGGTGTYYMRNGCFSNTACTSTVQYSSTGAACTPSPSPTRSRTPAASTTMSMSLSSSATPSITRSATQSATITASPSPSATSAPEYFLGSLGASCADTCTSNGLTCNPTIQTGNSVSMFSQLGVSCVADSGNWASSYHPGYVPGTGRCMGWCV
jgi:hypothetical protein